MLSGNWLLGVSLLDDGGYLAQSTPSGDGPAIAVPFTNPFHPFGADKRPKKAKDAVPDTVEPVTKPARATKPALVHAHRDSRDDELVLALLA